MLGCCPLFSILVKYRGSISINAPTCSRVKPRFNRASLMAKPKALKSYLSSFLRIIHHLCTFYCSCCNSDRYRKTYCIVVQFLLCVLKIKLCCRNGNKKNRYLAAYFPCVKNHIIFSRRRFNKSRRLFLHEI